MEFKTYLDTIESAADLARRLNVKQPTVSQWKHGVRVIPAMRCVAIEKATRGQVSRRDLRPNDWHQLWPELVDEAVQLIAPSEAASHKNFSEVPQIDAIHNLVNSP